MKKIKKLYLIDPKMKWGSFKALQDKMCIPDGGPTPQHLDKYLWQMNRDKQVFLYFCEEMKGDMGIGIKLPPHKEMVVLSNPKK